MQSKQSQSRVKRRGNVPVSVQSVYSREVLGNSCIVSESFKIFCVVKLFFWSDISGVQTAAF